MRAVDDLLAHILEIDCNPVADHGLHLSDPPIRELGVTN